MDVNPGDFKPLPETTHTIPSRLAVVESVYHQIQGRQPASIDTRFGRDLASHEQAFTRTCQVNQEWQLIQTGWLDNCGMLVIINEEGRYYTNIRTPEERAGVAKRVIEVGIAEHDEPTEHVLSCWVIPPGESARGMPVDVNSLRIRCLHGTARCTIVIIPR